MGTRIRSLVRWSIVSGFSIDVERREAFGWRQLNFDLAPIAVLYRISWTVSDDVLVRSSIPIFVACVGQVVHVVNAEEASAGYIGDVAEYRGP